MTTELRSNHGSKRLMGPYSDYTLMEHRRLLYQRVHALEEMVRAYGMGVEWRVGLSEGDWDYDATCEDPYDAMDRNRLLEGRVHALEVMIRASSSADSAPACERVGRHTEETSDSEERACRKDTYTERYKGYTFTCETVTDPLSPDAFGADDTVFLSAAHEAFTVSPARREDRRRYHLFPLYACIYDGDITLSLDNTLDPFNDPRYGCQVGWVFVKKGIGEDARAVAEDRVQEWHAFWRGDVWSFHVEDAEGQRVEGDDGLYGDVSWVAQEARAVIDALVGRTAG